MASARTLYGEYRSRTSRRWLQDCDQVGTGAVLEGRPYVLNGGEIVIGDDVAISSEPVQSHLVTGEGARLRVGDRVRIGHGAAISCQAGLDIGDDVTIGAFAMLMDSDFHAVGAHDVAPVARPIRIGRGARIGHRVVVLPGSSVGDFAVVVAGSVVSGTVPAGVTVSGNPARAHAGAHAAALPEDPARAIPLLVQEVLALRRLPDLGEGPDELPEWNSLGALRLILALEERFAITLTEEELRTAHSVRDLVDRVEVALRRSVPSLPANSGMK
jgi:maltose O-acetyltransferase